MKGQLVTIDGVDKTGKTTTADLVLENLSEAVYCKGQGDRTTMFGRLARTFPSTLTFLLELLASNQLKVRPMLKQGKTVIHDRYYSSIMVHPRARRWYNQLLFQLVKPLLIKPDKVVLLTVDCLEAGRRLAKDDDQNPFHDAIRNNPLLLLPQQERFNRLLNGKSVWRIDTTRMKPENVAKLVLDLIGGGNE